MSVALTVAGLLICAQPQHSTEKEESLTPSVVWLRSLEATYSLKRVDPKVSSIPVLPSKAYTVRSGSDYWASTGPDKLVRAGEFDTLAGMNVGSYDRLTVKSLDLAEGDVYVYAFHVFLGMPAKDETEAEPGQELGEKIGTIKVRRLDSGELEISRDVSDDAIAEDKSLDEEERKLLMRWAGGRRRTVVIWQKNDALQIRQSGTK